MGVTIFYLGPMYVLHFVTMQYNTLLTSSLVLDPQISYSGLLVDCGNDLDACVYLESTKECLHACFCAKYDKPLLALTAPVVSTSAMNGSPQMLISHLAAKTL